MAENDLRLCRGDVPTEAGLATVSMVDGLASDRLTGGNKIEPERFLRQYI